MTYLDVAKGAINTFMKYRARDPASQTDRYMLVSFDDPPSSIKVGWSNQFNSFHLKNLQARSLSTFSQSLKETLELLNVQRLHSGIDQYGQGRNPFYLEPAVIIALTDGGKYMRNGVNSCDIEEVATLPPPTGVSNGNELTKEMFRWDQRLFTVLLKFPGILCSDSGIVDDDIEEDSTYLQMSSLCEYTGGKCYSSVNLKSLSQIMESLCQKLHPGVVLNFRKIGSKECTNDSQTWKNKEHNTLIKSEERTPLLGLVNGQEEGGVIEDVNLSEQQNSWHNTRRMIFVRPNPKTAVPTGHWPIPESFWPDASIGTLPPRDVHPVVWFDANEKQPYLLESFAFDKYELESSPLTQQLLERKNPAMCWQVFISDSGRDKGIKYPFGYLKASSSGNFVNLFVMPFNYCKLLPLIEELQRQRLKPSSKWRSEFAEYISTVPNYYAQPLRKALQLMGAHHSLVPESFDGTMSYSITNYLRKLKKQSKIDTAELTALVARGRQDTNNNKKSSKIIDAVNNGISISIGSTEVESVSNQSYRNPYDIPRTSLLGQVSRMRANFLHSSINTPHLIEEVDKHQVPIGQMGNYQQHLKKINPLRELDTGAVRTQLFGNPFKLEKSTDKRGPNDIANLADEMMVEHLKRPGSPSRNPRRRKLRSLSPSTLPILPKTQTKFSEQQQLKQDSQNGSNSESQNHTEAQNFVSTSSKELENTDSSSPEPMEVDKTMVTTSKTMVTTGPLEGSRQEINRNSITQIIPDPLLKIPLMDDKSSVTDKLKDKVNRKRTPSPTSLIAPPSKRPNKDSRLPVLESLSKVNNKSPSPSPLLAPIRQSSLSSASQVLNEEFKRKQTTENLKLKQVIGKEIRKHTKNYDVIFQNLENIQGSFETKKTFVQDVIKEAERFRKKPLIQFLEEWLTKLGEGRGGTRGIGGGGEKLKGVKSTSKSSSIPR